MKFSIFGFLVFLTTITASGADVDKEKNRNVVNNHLKDLRTCYEDQLSSHPNLSGKLIINWNVDDKGTVTKEVEIDKAKTTLNNEAVQSCVAKKIKTWTFPPAPAGTTVSISYPFIFSH